MLFAQDIFASFRNTCHIKNSNIYWNIVYLFAAKDNIDEEDKVRRVLELYNAIGLHSAIEQAIDKEFQKATRSLDDIHAPEPQKTPLREMMESLNGRKK